MSDPRRSLRSVVLALATMVALSALGTVLPARPASAAEATDPIYGADFPDPSLLRVGGLTYAYATNGRENVRVIASPDLHTWQRLGDALPQLPSWAAPGFTWAPSVLQRGPDSFVLYFTARHRATGTQCIGRASSTRPDGPFRDDSAEPLVCQFSLRGSIDPQPFVDGDGTAYVLYKSEGKTGEPTRIWTQRLSANGLALNGPAVELTHEDQPWEEPLIEGPVMLQAAGSYWLFYAGSRWETASYAIGYARCATPVGPCMKDGSGPLIASTGTMAGPGSPDITTALDGTLLLTFHAWTTGRVGYPSGARTLRALPLTFVAGKPTVPGAVRRTGEGYRLVASDGGIFSFGRAGFYGSTGGLALNQPIRTMATTPSGNGYWLAATDGGMFSFGDAGFFGSTGGLRLNQPIVGMSPTPSGNGYWLVASDGGIFSFGDAGFFGSTGAVRLNKPIVGMAPTASGRGYWLVASDGGIFSFGDAAFFGSTGNIALNSPIVALVPRLWSDGYWMVAADGGVFTFGAAEFLGSAGGLKLDSPIVGASAAPAGDGYWFVAADGGVFNFGRSGFYGSAGGSPLSRPVVGMAA